MITVAEMKKHVTQLIETNRALIDDLDVSRRLSAQLGRERDALQVTVDDLRARIQRLKMQSRDEASPAELRRLRQELTAQRRAAEQALQQRELLQCDAEALRAEAELAEECIQALTAQVDSVQRERDTFRARLDEAEEALDEIRLHLQAEIAA